MKTNVSHWPNPRIGIIGLGYVGLPLAVEFGKHFPTVGYDVRTDRIEQLRAGLDRTLETSTEELQAASHLTCSADPADLADCNVYIVTVPTPIDAAKRPDLTPLIKASETVGRLLKPGDVVVYESTVYPGCTEEICVPILERLSGLCYATTADRGPNPVGAEPSRRSAPNPGTDPVSPGPVLSGVEAGPGSYNFYVGYSPERINPGDKQHRLTSITKITSGSTPEVAAYVDALYRTIVTAGTHLAPSIRVAEAAKVIENTQRDVNIALINELAILFNRLGLDTDAVLAAAGSKWNFLPFRPGLVGGHCIGVDPYYLTHKAQEVGCHPEMILAGRRINDGMGQYIATEVVKLMLSNGLAVLDAPILVLGLTFKENCPDLRNTRVIDLIQELREYGARVDVHDPWADLDEAREEYGLDLIQPQTGHYGAIVLAVAHDQYRNQGVATLRAYGQPGAVVYDVKHVFPADEVDGRL
jgi:UDP-N-acetyl-D-galactosamine dehydrogenase